MKSINPAAAGWKRFSGNTYGMRVVEQDIEQFAREHVGFIVLVADGHGTVL